MQALSLWRMKATEWPAQISESGGLIMANEHNKPISLSRLNEKVVQI